MMRLYSKENDEENKSDKKKFNIYTGSDNSDDENDNLKKANILIG